MKDLRRIELSGWNNEEASSDQLLPFIGNYQRVLAGMARPPGDKEFRCFDILLSSTVLYDYFPRFGISAQRTTCRISNF
jgi:hypothetical protein